MPRQRRFECSSPGPLDRVMKCGVAYLLEFQLRYVLYVLQRTTPERIYHVIFLLTTGNLRTSANFAKLSFILTSISPRPSAARRLSKGIVYPLEFYSLVSGWENTFDNQYTFQLETDGGIFHASLSSSVSFRGGL